MLKVGVQSAGWYNKNDPLGSFEYIKECGFESIDFNIDHYMSTGKLVKEGISSSGDLNRASLAYVKASEQAAAMRRILPVLSEEEEQVFKRGRNMSGGNVPKSATMSEYRTATGMEVLFGYLHYLGRAERIDELFEIAYQKI